ncbi:MAG: antitoxin FitA [Alphaproteobacteria bacterium]|jgi:plasmid stability protein|nr:antitoxin FitA [Alphaproteobacteria bacterium]
MSKMIQLRNVPDTLHRKLKARAALEGLSLSDFLTREARKIADQPTDEEIRARLAGRPVLRLSPSPTEILREERDRR